jgi:nitrogen regulatory protein PII
MDKIKIITCVVERGRAEGIIKAAIDAGAEGATILFGRGTGVREKLGLMGRFIEAEKEVIITATRSEKVDEIFDAMVERGNLKQPGYGFIYVQDAEKAIGFLDPEK